MKRSNLVFLVLGVTIIFFGCSEDNVAPELDQRDQVTTFDQVTTSSENAKKPSPNLTGEMLLDFVPGGFGPVNPIWVGTISFEGIGVFGIRFFHLSPFRDYSQASPFEETFEIYALGDPLVVLLGGPDVGVTTLANKPPEDCKYRMNGEIEVAMAPFEEWLGRKVHMSGIITWQNLGTAEAPIIAPATAPGTLRIN
jgi:hypothetical protein